MTDHGAGFLTQLVRVLCFWGRVEISVWAGQVLDLEIHLRGRLVDFGK